MPNDSNAPSSRVIDWAALVRKAWGPEYDQPDKAYEWSNGRKHDSTDGARGGIYAGTSGS